MTNIEELHLSGQPVPFGVTFVPRDVLVSGGEKSEEYNTMSAEGSTGPDVSLAGFARGCHALGAAFAFVTAGSNVEDQTIAFQAEDVAPFYVLDGPLWLLIEAYGVMEGLRRTLADPEGFGAEINRGMQRLRGGVVQAARIGARAIVLAEDLAGNEGPLVAPDFVIAELMPRYAPLVTHARELGLPAIFHSDGDIRPLLRAIARAGFTGVHAGGGLDAEGFMRLFHAARTEGLAVIGGLLTSELISATRAEALGGALGRLARGGGLVLADDGGITTQEQMECLKIALEVARSV